MNGTWNLKLFLSISLGLHFFVLFLFSVLFPNFKIAQPPVLNIEVSLLPLVREEKEPLDKSKVRSLARPAERILVGAFRVRSKEEEPLKKPEERVIETQVELPVKTDEERKVADAEKVEVSPTQKEPESFLTPTVQTEVRIISVSEPQFSPTVSEMRGTENKKEERVVIASLRNPVPSLSSPETPQMVMKSPSLSENQIAIAQPRYSENPKPVYPREAKNKGYEGEVLLRVEVLSSGRVGEVEIKRSSGHDILDRSAMTAVKRWKFVPAKKGETAVPVWVNIPVTFELR